MYLLRKRTAVSKIAAQLSPESRPLPESNRPSHTEPVFV
jgi:hypothetical protein